MLYDSETTLGDLNRIDRDNFNHINGRHGKEYKFTTVRDAYVFMGQSLDRILRKSGVKIRPGMDATRINRMLDSREVRVEHRDYGPDEPLYMSGAFVYDHKEIAGFVSRPFYRKSERIHLLPAFYVRVVENQAVHGTVPDVGRAS